MEESVLASLKNSKVKNDRYLSRSRPETIRHGCWRAYTDSYTRVGLRLTSGSRELGHSPVTLFGIVALFLVAATALGGKASSQELIRPDLNVFHGFSFSPGACEQGPDFCAVSTPRSWAPTEIEIVRGALDEIEANDVARRIVQRARLNGFQGIRRFAYAARLNAQGLYEVDPTIAATAHRDDRDSIRTLDLTNQFFERKSARDHFSGDPGYLLTTEILVHELMHAIDFDQRYSSSLEFRRVAGLWMTELNQREATRVNIDRVRLNAAGRYEDSWRASRAFGVVTMAGHLPSVQALDSYREAFAEFGAHFVLDPYARRRFDPRIVRYFDEVVSRAPYQSPDR